MRNEDYDRELLVTVALICVTISVVSSLFEGPRPSPAVATASRQQETVDLSSVRIVGTPFVPNTNPSQR